MGEARGISSLPVLDQLRARQTPFCCATNGIQSRAKKSCLGLHALVRTGGLPKREAWEGALGPNHPPASSPTVVSSALLQEELRRDLKIKREKEAAQATAVAAPIPVPAVPPAPPAPPPSPPLPPPPLQHAAPLATATATMPTAAQKRKREEERDSSAKAKKKKMISTTSKETKKDTKLYCICKTPYDESK